MAVNPQMKLGDPISGFGGDSLRQAYATYNAHTHGESLGSPFYSGFVPGMFVTGKNALNQDLFATNTRVVEVTAKGLRVDLPPINYGANVSLLGIKAGYPNASCQDSATVNVGDVFIPVGHQGGEISKDLAAQVQTHILSGLVYISDLPRDVLVTIVDDQEVRTPLNYTAIFPVLIRPPYTGALAGMSGMLVTSLGETDLNFKGHLRVRINRGSALVEEAECLNNTSSHTSTVWFGYTANQSPIVTTQDTVYLVLVLDQSLSFPPDLRLCYTLWYMDTK